MAELRAVQTGLQANFLGDGVPAVTQTGMLAAFGPPGALSVDVVQTGLQAAFEGSGVPAVSQAAMLVAYRTNAPDDLSSRAWTLTLDGHEFYAVTLGEEGTWVYDLSTSQWSQWGTEGLSSWNMERGITWRGDIIAADRFNPIIWRIDPESFIDDDFRPQIRRVSGGLSVRNRTFVGNYAFRLTASLGTPSVPNTAPATLPTVELSVSDDQGRNYVSAGSVTVQEGVFQQDLQWLSLGLIQPPMRVFRVTDTGAVARISGADAEVDQEEGP